MDQRHSPPVFRQPGGLHRRTRLVSLVTWLNITVQLVFPVAIAFTPAITRAAERGPRVTQPASSMAPLPEVTWDDKAPAGDEQASRMAGYASQVGGALGQHGSSDAAASLARSMATGAAGGAVQDWLSQFGTARVQLDADRSFSLKNSQFDMLVPLWEQPDMLAFTQTGLHRADDRTQGNLGFGLRWFAADYMLGANTFFDYDFSRYHYRAGVGAEYWRDYLKLSANGYLRLSDWRDSPDVTDYEARPANGWDIRTEGYLPAWPHLGATLKYEQYYGNEVALFGTENRQRDPHAITAGLTYTPVPLLTLSAEQRQGQSGRHDTRIGAEVTVQPGVAWSKQTDPDAVAALRSLAGSRHDLVDRNSDIVLEYRKKEVIRLKMASLVTGTGGEQKSLGVSVNSKYGYAGMAWSAAEFEAAGGQLVADTTGPGWSVVLPAYRYGPQAVNNYMLSAVALDTKGNRSARAESQVTVNAPAISAASSTFTPAEVNLPADGLSTQELALTTRDDAGQLVDVPADIIAINVTPVAQRASALRAAAAGVQLSPLTRVSPGVYKTVLTAGTGLGAWSVTPSVNGMALSTITVTLNQVAPDADKSSFKVDPDSIPADGSTVATLTFSANDANGNAIPGLADSLALGVKNSAGAPPAEGDVQVSNLSESAAGVYTARLTGTLADSYTLTPLYNNKTVGNLSVTLTLNSLKPDAPGALTFSADGAILAGKAAVGTTVTVMWEGTVLGSVMVGADGTFTLKLDPPQNDGQTLTVTATDAAGRVSDPTTITAPIIAPDAPTELNVTEDGMTLTGLATPGDTVKVTDGTLDRERVVPVNEDGTFSVTLTPPQVNGETLSVTVFSPGGHPGPSATVQAPDNTPPPAPTNLTFSTDGATLKGHAEAGTRVIASAAEGEPVGHTVALADGSFTLQLDPPQTDGQTLLITAVDAKGHISDPTTVTAPVVPPAAPTDLMFSATGDILTGKAIANGSVKVSGGSLEEETSAPVSSTGEFTVSLTPPQVNGETLKITAISPAGHPGASATVMAPDLTPPPMPEDLAFSADGATLTGRAEADTTVIVTYEGTTVGRNLVRADGSFSVTLTPAQTKGQILMVISVDVGGNISDPAEATAPLLPPEPPAALAFSQDGSTLSGRAEAGGRVDASVNGEQLASGEAGPDGRFSLALSPPLDDGQTVTVTVTDSLGNVSTPVNVTAPVVPPPAPVGVGITVDGTMLTGLATPNDTVKVTGGTLEPEPEATIHADGSFNVPLTPPQVHGETLTVTVYSPAGHPGASVTVVAPELPPPMPDQLIISDDGANLSGHAEPQSVVAVLYKERELARVTVGADGAFLMEFSPPQTDGQTLTVIAINAKGQVSAAATVTAPIIPPAAPSDLAITVDGVTLTGHAVPGGTVSVMEGTLEQTIVGPVDSQGNFSVILTPPQIHGETLAVVAFSPAGHPGPATSIVAPDLPPPIPGNLQISDDGSTLSGTAEASSNVTVTSQGTELGNVIADMDGSFMMDLAIPQTDGQTLSVTATNERGLVSKPATVTAPIIPPAAPSDLMITMDGSSLSGIAIADGTVQVTGGTLEHEITVTVDHDGNFTAPLTPQQVSGETLTLIAFSPAGHPGPAASITAPDIAPPPPPANLAVSADGSAVSGTAQSLSTVTVSGEGMVLGSVQAGIDGRFTAVLAQAQTDGQTLTVTATNAVGKVSEPATVKAPLPVSPACQEVNAIEKNHSFTKRDFVGFYQGESVTAHITTNGEPGEGVPGDYVSFGKAGTGQLADKIWFFAKEGEAGDHIKKVESLFIMAGPTENNGLSVAAFMDKQITALSFTCSRSQ